MLQRAVARKPIKFVGDAILLLHKSVQADPGETPGRPDAFAAARADRQRKRELAAGGAKFWSHKIKPARLSPAASPSLVMPYLDQWIHFSLLYICERIGAAGVQLKEMNFGEYDKSKY